MTNDTVQAPTPAQLKEIAGELGFDLSEAELAAFGELIGPSIDAYNAVDRMAQELPPVKYQRSPGYRPSDEENPHGAWYVGTTIEGAPVASSRARRSRSRTTYASPTCR
jgi:amidase